MKWALWFILAISVGAQGQELRRPTLNILPQPQIEVMAGKEITLADLGSVSFVSREVQNRAHSLVIFESLNAGEEKDLTSATLVKMLRDRIQEEGSLNTYNWSYFVPDRIKLRGQSTSLPTQRVQLRILAALQEKCETCSFLLRDLKYPKFSSAETLENFEMDLSGLKTVGSFLIPVRAQVSGQERIVYVTGLVATKVEALVLKRNLTAGEVLGPSDYQLLKTDLLLGQEPFAAQEDLRGRVLVRSVAQGRPLLRSDLKKEILVQRGQLVQVLAGDDQFEVSMQGQAEESGSIGDLIKIKNQETSKLMSGKIVDRGVVRME